MPINSGAPKGGGEGGRVTLPSKFVRPVFST